ncbi:MAG: hypothetical protein P8N76_21530 [Pirellulaceae bacterium]|nr:hypothetical protein [Pirellulaceae bacterium]
MTEFEKRLSKAIERGSYRNAERARKAKEKALSEEELKNLHTKYRLEFSEHIEECMKQLPNHFPGFQHESIYGDRGWGAACSRDDLGPGNAGRRANYYSRLEMSIRPFSDYHVVDLAAKATIRNKEVFSRSHFQLLNEVDTDTFLHLIDVWILEYAELYAAS